MESLIGNFKYNKDENGNWLWKAVKPVTKQRKLKAEYKDLPRLKAIYTIEDYWLKKFESTIHTGLKEGLKNLF